MDTKICSKCKAYKPLSDFYKKSSTKDGLQYHCKSCKTLYNQSHYQLHTEMYKLKADLRSKSILDRNRRFIRSYLSQNPCVDCGETDPVVLEFDHREQPEKRYTISNVLGWISEELLLIEIAKCDVRCANCHRRRTAIQLGWYAWLDDESVVQ